MPLILLMVAMVASVIYIPKLLSKRSMESRASAFNETGNNFFVDKDNKGGKGCNDTWPGTIDQPFCTVAKGLSTFSPGDNLYIRAGIYAPFVVTRSGSSNAYFNISAYNNEKVVVEGGTAAIKLSGVSYVRIYGFEVTGAIGSWGGAIYVTPNGSAIPNHNIIENNSVHNNNTSGTNTNGILIEDGSYNQVLNNITYANDLSGIRVLSHATKSPNGVTGNEVTGNISYNNTGSGGNSDGISLEGSGTKNTLVSNNTTYGNSDDGIDSWNTSHNVITGNIAYGQVGTGDGNGIKVGGGVTGGYNLVKQNISYGNKARGFDPNGTGGNVFYNNTAYNNKYGFDDGWKESPCTFTTCQDTYINNIGYNNTTANFVASAYVNVSHNNLWYSDSGSPKVLYNYVSASSLAAFYTASGNRLDNPNAGSLSSLSANPKFTNAAGGVFTLLSGSPTIDHGDPANPGQIGAVNVPDMGAIEFGSSSGTTPTPTPTVVVSGDTIAPQVSITLPANGATFSTRSTVSISAVGTDNIGVSKMEFYVNNSLVSSVTSSSYTYKFKTSNRAKTYSIIVKATDKSGNVGSSSITISTK